MCDSFALYYVLRCSPVLYSSVRLSSNLLSIMHCNNRITASNQYFLELNSFHYSTVFTQNKERFSMMG